MAANHPVDEASALGKALVLIHARPGSGDRTTAELARVAFVVGTWAKRVERVAVVARPGHQFGRTRMAASMAAAGDLNVMVCRGMEEAEESLGRGRSGGADGA